MLWITAPDPKGGVSDLPLTSGFFNDVQHASRSCEALAAFRAWSYSLATASGGDPEPVAGARVSPSLFEVLGARPLLGLTFGKESAVPGGPRVALISYSLWQRHFGGDGSVVGKQVLLSGQSFTVVGVMRPGFAFPRGAELPAPFGF